VLQEPAGDGVPRFVECDDLLLLGLVRYGGGRRAGWVEARPSQCAAQRRNTIISVCGAEKRREVKLGRKAGGS
jgi:hypothetical protein